MLRVTELTKKVWVHTAMEKSLNQKIAALAKRLDKPKYEVLSAIVAKGLRAADAPTTKATTKRSKTKR